MPQLIFRIPKKVFFFFFENFDLLKTFFLKLLCQLNTDLKLYNKRFFGKVDLFGPLLGDIEATPLCSFDLI